MFAVFHRKLSALREDVVTHPPLLATLDLLHYLDVRMQFLLAVVDDDALAQPRYLVEFFSDCFVLDDIRESHYPTHISDDWVGVRIPGKQQVTAFQFLAFGDIESRAERYLEPRADLTVLIV